MLKNNINGIKYSNLHIGKRKLTVQLTTENNFHTLCVYLNFKTEPDNEFYSLLKLRMLFYRIHSMSTL